MNMYIYQFIHIYLSIYLSIYEERHFSAIVIGNAICFSFQTHTSVMSTGTFFSRKVLCEATVGWRDGFCKTS